jgi:hypothetical protein
VGNDDDGILFGWGVTYYCLVYEFSMIIRGRECYLLAGSVSGSHGQGLQSARTFW